MILNLQDKDGKDFAFSTDAIVACIQHPTLPTHCRLYLGHMNGTPLDAHFTVRELMETIGHAMNQVSNRANLLGGVGPLPKQ